MIYKILWEGFKVLCGMLAFMFVAIGTVLGVCFFVKQFPIISIGIFLVSTIIYYGLDATEDERKRARWDKESKS